MPNIALWALRDPQTAELAHQKGTFGFRLFGSPNPLSGLDFSC